MRETYAFQVKQKEGCKPMTLKMFLCILLD